MFKKIHPSDISVRPFKVHKTWEFASSSAELSVLEAEKGTNLSTTTTTDHHHENGQIIEHNHLTFNKHSLWSQINSQFYSTKTEYNPFSTFSSVPINYTVQIRQRELSNKAKIISIPQKYIGEGIKKNSLSLTDNELNYIDDGKGNIIRTGGITIIVTELDLETNEFVFQDLQGDTYNATAEITFIDLNEGYVNIEYQSTEYVLYLINYDLEEEKMVLQNVPFLTEGAGAQKIGNIFYEMGLIVITENPDIALTQEWYLNFKSTHTIYENEYLLATGENEFNISTNPTAIEIVGKIEEQIETYDQTNPNFKPYKVKVQPYVGTSYIKKLSYDENGEPIDYRYTSKVNASIKGGFEQYDLSGSVDLTGSFLAPYITTIGLYDDDCNLLAVAKLPQPIKSIPDLNINFLVRFDT